MQEISDVTEGNVSEGKNTEVLGVVSLFTFLSLLWVEHSSPRWQGCLGSVQPSSFLNLWYVCSEPKAKGIYMVVGSIFPKELKAFCNSQFFNKL